MDFLTELNEQANAVCKELIKAKRAAKAEKGVKVAYQNGRVEELEKWLGSLEKMIEKITERREAATDRPDGVKWISVSEKLPAENGSYLVIGKSGTPHTAHFYKSVTDANGRTYKTHFSNRYVKYWAELPPPPKEALEIITEREDAKQ